MRPHWLPTMLSLLVISATVPPLMAQERPRIPGISHVAVKAKAKLESSLYRSKYDKPIEVRVGKNRKRQLNLYDPDGTRVELMEPNTVDRVPVPSSKRAPPAAAVSWQVGTSIATCWAGLSPASPRGFLLGFFGATERPTHAVVVNLDYAAEASTSLIGPSEPELFNAPTAQWTSPKTAVIALILPPGGGKLVRITR